MLQKRFLMAFLRKYFMWEEEEEEAIPKDVPKGHMAVYVGEEDRKRFVIHLSALDHPLFRTLLDRAQEVYEFSPDVKLRIPCDEAVFLGVLRCVGSQRGDRRNILLCF